MKTHLEAGENIKRKVCYKISVDYLFGFFFFNVRYLIQLTLILIVGAS